MSGREIQRIVQRMGNLVALIFALIGLVSCQGDYYTNTQTAAWIDSDGGTVYGPKGARVIVPVLAVPQPVRLVLDELSAASVPEFLVDGEPLARMSMALWLEPEGLHFTRNVEIGMRYIAEGMTEETQQRSIRVFEMSHHGTEWSEVETTVDVKSKMVRFEVDHLAVFSVFRVEADEEENSGEEPEHDPCTCLGDEAGYCPDAGVPVGELESIELLEITDETCSMDLVLHKTGEEEGVVVRVVPCDVLSMFFYARDGTECTLEWRGTTEDFFVDCGGERIDTYSTASCP